MEDNTFWIYVACGVVYIEGILLPNKLKDILALSLIAIFMFALGLRDTNKMVDLYGSNDPMNYASLLTNVVDLSKQNYANDLSRPDFLLFRVLGFFTSNFLNYPAAFMFLNLLYIPLIYLLYRLFSHTESGIFYLFAGCLLFTNTGVLLLANFFREGTCILTVIALILYIGRSQSKKAVRLFGLLILPFLHLTSLPLMAQLFLAKRKTYKLLAGVVFVTFCGLAYVLLSELGAYAVYVSGKANPMFMGRDLTLELIIKICVVYVVTIMAMFIRRYASSERKQVLSPFIRIIEGMTIPSVALAVFIQSAPEVASRYIYYFQLLAFLDLILSAMVLRSSLFRQVFNVLWPLLIVCLGYFMWSFPTVSRLLKW